MLQNKKPDDFVISTGKQYSIRDFINICLKKLKIDVVWSGKGLKETAIVNLKIKNIKSKQSKNYKSK